MRRLLIVVDYQNDFVTGALGFKGAEKLEPGILELVKEFDRAGDYIWFTFDTHDDHYLESQEGKLLPVPHCKGNTNGWMLCPGLDKYLDDVGEDKHYNIELISKNTFGATGMARLDYAEFDEIHFCGVVTNMCVISNAVMAKTYSPESKIIIHADICGSFDREMHYKALDVMKSMQMFIEGDDREDG